MYIIWIVNRKKGGVVKLNIRVQRKQKGGGGQGNGKCEKRKKKKKRKKIKENGSFKIKQSINVMYRWKNDEKKVKS